MSKFRLFLILSSAFVIYCRVEEVTKELYSEPDNELDNDLFETESDSTIEDFIIYDDDFFVNVEISGCPIAIIETDISGEVPIGTLVHLDGSKSYDPDGDSIHSFYWKTKSSISDEILFLPSANFPSPSFSSGKPQTVYVYLRVFDSNLIISCNIAEAVIKFIPD